MNRRLKLRTIGLVVAILFCAGTLAPSFIARNRLPSWFTTLFHARINLGLDLQGGLRMVYGIDLDKAVDDRASEIKRDLDARFTDDKIDGVVKTPSVPLGAVTVILKDASKKAEITDQLEHDYGDTIAPRECEPGAGPNAICILVSSSYAEGIKRAALTNAVSTIRERIDEKGVAEPTVIEKGDEIIVELPGIDDETIAETKDIIARTAKLEMKVVDDCASASPQGCTTAGTHDGSPYMQALFKHVGSDKHGNPNDPEAIRLAIKAEVDQWRPEEGGGQHTDFYLFAYDRDEAVPVTWAKKRGKVTKNAKVEGDKVVVPISGREIIERYVFGDQDLGYQGLADKDPAFKVPDDHQLAFELVEPQPDAKDRRKFWRTYYLERAVRLTGSAISNATGGYDPNTNRPIVQLEFNRVGGRIFGEVTSRIVGMKFATILDDKVKSAPIINGAIRGGRAAITMGGSDPRQMERERDGLVAVLKTGSLPAPLREESANKVGATLGGDAITKTRLSFVLGVVLVIVLMVGVYRWSGWVAVFAVMFHILVTLAVMALFGATLTLPGIAALVLSVGMCVDGNVLINERIRDELLLGKSVRGAVELGFSRAFSAIVDGQLTIAASAVVLLQYGSGPIKGFAVMMLVGVFTTIMTNTWVTRILFDWGVSRNRNATTLSI
jgi:preprotein translocase subunit SecD